MESESSGNFRNYSKEYGANKGDSINNCPDKISFELEDIGRCPFYQTNNNVPPIGATIRLKEKLYNNRLAIEDIHNLVVGLVPVEYNDLLECLKSGNKYSGKVTGSTSNPLLYVFVEIVKG